MIISYRMRYSYIHCNSEIGTHEKPNNPVFYCCYIFLVASLMSICFTGHHRQYALFDYMVKLYFVILYSCVLLEINLLLLLLFIVIVPLRFQKIVWATCPHISLSTCCMFCPPAWWALRLHWWPLAECSNASMYLVLISTNVFVPVSSLYSAGNKTYYYYHIGWIHLLLLVHWLTYPNTGIWMQVTYCTQTWSNWPSSCRRPLLLYLHGSTFYIH